jgi:hypothetical protein
MSPIPERYPSTAAAQRRQRQLQLLEAALQVGAPAAPADAIRRSSALETALQAWLAAAPGEQELLAGLTALMRSALSASGATPAPDPPALAVALARALVAQADAEVSREARRAGHGGTLDALRPWLQTPLPDAAGRELARRLGLPPEHLQRALARLRRRFRQRIDSGLALWSADAGQRNLLRRQLHAALSSGESPS